MKQEILGVCLLLASTILVGCGGDWYYTTLDVKSEVTDPDVFEVRVGEKATKIKTNEIKTVYSLEPTADEEESAVVEAVFDFGDYEMDGSFAIKTHEGEPGQVLLRVYESDDNIYIERINVIYDE